MILPSLPGVLQKNKFTKKTLAGLICININIGIVNQTDNKLHYAIHNHTAAELIEKRADSNKEHMGLTSWKKQRMKSNRVTGDKICANRHGNFNEFFRLGHYIFAINFSSIISKASSTLN